MQAFYKNIPVLIFTWLAMYNCGYKSNNYKYPEKFPYVVKVTKKLKELDKFDLNSYNTFRSLKWHWPKLKFSKQFRI